MSTTTETLSPHVARVRSQIAAGTYETPARIDGACDRLLDDLRMDDAERELREGEERDGDLSRDDRFAGI